MTAQSLYKEALLDHYRNPRNKADPGGAAVVRRGRNPRCGDDIEIGVDFEGDTVSRVRFRGRGCSICIASASIMTEATSGRNVGDVRVLTDFIHEWFADDAPADADAPQLLLPLSPVRGLPARRRCVLLAWEAMKEALTGLPEA